MSKAHKLTRESAARFLDAQRTTAVARACEYGHVDCSDRDGGACLDEVLGLFPEYADN